MFTLFRTVFQFFGTYRLPSYFREFCEFSYNNLRMPLNYYPYYVPDDLYVSYPHVYLWGPLAILLVVRYGWVWPLCGGVLVYPQSE